jgi:hypothetical protein
MALVGMRDIRDYLVQVRPESESKGLASPFNVKKKALTLANFNTEQINELYQQHTEASGQIFDDQAIDRVWYWSEGQPWLVNALAYEAVTEILNNDHSTTITGALMDQAAEALIRRRDTHIDSLLERLKEPRVIQVMDSVFSGTISQAPLGSDDRRYCLDLGLVSLDQDGNLRPANAIYKEVMSRVITDEIQHVLDQKLSNLKWTDGQVVLMNELLKEFQNFWRHNSDSFPKRLKNFTAYKYDEATFSFMLLAYLQKIVNGGDLVHGEFSEGRKVVDICVVYQKNEYIIEVKLKGEDSREDSLKQLAGYLDVNGEKVGWLVIFDRNLKKKWEDKIAWETVQFENFTINIVSC